MVTLKKPHIMLATDLNNAISKEGILLNIDFKRLSFYLNNLWIVRILNWLRLTYIMRLEVTACNIKLEQKAAELRKILEHFKSNKATSDDLNVIVEYFNGQLDILSKLNGDIEKIFLFKLHKMLGDFETTNRLVVEILESTYDIVRILKKQNKKVPIPTSQLAKDTAAHSISTLSKIINGN